MIKDSRGFEKDYVGEKNSVLTEAVLKGLSQENAGSDGQISGDRLFDYISAALKGSGQEPIRMGWGRPITLVSYPPGSQPLVSTSQGTQASNSETSSPEQSKSELAPQPAQTSYIGNTINISDSTMTNFAGFGQINYKQAPNSTLDN